MIPSLDYSEIELPQLPNWVVDEQRQVLLDDPCTLASQCHSRTALPDSDVKNFEGRFLIPILGMLVVPNPSHFETPQRNQGIDWSDVAFRLTLGWQEGET